MSGEQLFTGWTLIYLAVWLTAGAWAWRVRHRLPLAHAISLALLLASFLQVIEYLLTPLFAFWPPESWWKRWVVDPLTALAAVPLAWGLREARHRRHPKPSDSRPPRLLQRIECLGTSRAPAREHQGPPPQHQGWLLVRLVYEGLWRLWRGWNRLPVRSHRVWWTTLAVGLALLVVLSAALTWATRELAERGALGWEPTVLRWLERSGWPSLATALWMGFPGNALILWPLVVLSAGWAAWRGRPVRALAILVGMALVEVPVFAGWQLWGRDRPQVLFEQLQVVGASFKSFPSGHMAHSVFFFGLLTAFWRQASPRKAERAFALTLWWLIAALVAVGRLRVGTHWPTDILGGAIVGGLWLAVVLAALRRAERAGAQ